MKTKSLSVTGARTAERNASRNIFNDIRQFLAANHTFELTSEARSLSGRIDELESGVIQLQAQRDELLAACKRFVDYYDQPNRVYQLGNGQASKSFHEIKAAIAKVEAAQ